MASDDNTQTAKRSFIDDILSHPAVKGPDAGAASKVTPMVPPDPDLADEEAFESELAKKSDPLPRASEEYRPHARFLNRLSAPPTVIHFVKKDCLPKGFAYDHFEWIEKVPSATPGGGIDLVVRFCGSEITDVRIEGRNLDFVYTCIAMKIMPWIWERPGGIHDERKFSRVITKISVESSKR